jgi:hypothetical protein
MSTPCRLAPICFFLRELEKQIYLTTKGLDVTFLGGDEQIRSGLEPAQ